MLERNKTIFKILLIVSAVIFVGGLITLLLRHPIVWTDVCFYFFMIVFLHVVAFLSLKYPKLNKSYSLVRINGKWRMGRMDLANDTNGYRYIIVGILSLFFTILMTIYHLTQNETFILWSTIVLCVILIALSIYFTNKIGIK